MSKGDGKKKNGDSRKIKQVYLSEDGENFELAATVHKEIQKPSQSYVTFGAVLSAKARYVRFVSRQSRGFQFLDEIIVN